MAFASLLSLTVLLVFAVSGKAEDDPGYAWMSESGDGHASLVYGSPETAEDLVFILLCQNDDKLKQLTVYVDIAGTEIGEKVAVELAAGSHALALDGAISTDEMSGFHFAVAEDFAIRPLIGLLGGTGEVTVKTGSVVTTLPAKGRAAELANFAKACTLD